MGEYLQVDRLYSHGGLKLLPSSSIQYDKAARYPFPVQFKTPYRSQPVDGLSVASHPSSSRSIDDYRPKMVRDLSHQRILAMGIDVNQRMEQSIEDERQRILSETTLAVWKEADDRQSRALEELKAKMQAQERRAMDKLNRLHQRSLHEKLANLESVLKKEASDALEIQKREAKAELEAALKKLEEEWCEKLRIAVEEAREEEIAKAEVERKQLIELHKTQVQTMRKQFIEEKQIALQKQKKELERKLEENERILRLEEQKKTLQALAEQKVHHERQVQLLLDSLEKANEQQNHLRQELLNTNNEKDAVEAEVLKTRQIFMDFIHRALRVHTGQADYLLPTDKLVASILEKMDSHKESPYRRISYPDAAISEKSPVPKKEYHRELTSTLEHNLEHLKETRGFCSLTDDFV